jgi:hypothetical protein
MLKKTIVEKERRRAHDLSWRTPHCSSWPSITLRMEKGLVIVEHSHFYAIREQPLKTDPGQSFRILQGGSKSREINSFATSSIENVRIITLKSLKRKL